MGESEISACKQILFIIMNWNLRQFVSLVVFRIFKMFYQCQLCN